MARVIRRRYLGGAAATVGGVLAAACGTPEVRYVEKPVITEKVVTVEKPVVVEKIVEKIVEKPAMAAGPKTIIFDTDWCPSGPRAEVTNRGVDAFMAKHPNVKVDIRCEAGRETAGSGSVFARSAVLIAADDMGDMFLWAGYVFVYWAKRGLFQDITPFMAQYKVTLDDYIHVPQHEVWPYPNGKIWGWPFQSGASDYLYNKSVLDRHGIEPSDDWTWDDVVEVAKQVQDPANNIWGMAPPSELTLMYQIGGQKGTDNGEYYLYDSPVGHQAMQFRYDLFHKHQLAPTPQAASEMGDRRPSSSKGNYVFWMGHPSAAFRKAMEENNFEAQLMRGPKWPANGLRAVSGFDQPHIITKWAGTHDVVAEAAALSAHMAGPETSDFILKYGNTGPTWKATYDSDAYLDSSRWNRNIIMEGFEHRFGDQAQEWWYPMYRARGPVLGQVWNGELSPLDGAREIGRLHKVIAELKTLHPPTNVLQADLG